MVRVLDIWAETKKIVGNHDNTFLFRRLTDAVELLSNKGDFDPLLGTLDIWTDDRHVTLPREVETILGLNMAGRPAMARDELFRFHLNGLSQHERAIRYEWMDESDSFLFRDLKCPGRLYGYCTAPGDDNAEFWVEGLDTNGNVIRTLTSDGWRNGWKVPLFSSTPTIDTDAPVFARITRVSKPVTEGPLTLATVYNDAERVLGVYQADETVPRFRRIRLSQCVPCVRIRFRRRTFAITSLYDLIPLHSAQAVLMMLRALKEYDSPGGIPAGEACEATASRWLAEEQFTRNPPVVHPMQVSDAAPLLDQGDVID